MSTDNLVYSPRSGSPIYLRTNNPTATKLTLGAPIKADETSTSLCYEATKAGSDKPEYFVKFPLIRSGIGASALQELTDRYGKFYKNQYRHQLKLNELNRRNAHPVAPLTLDVGDIPIQYDGTPQHIPYIIQEYVSGSNLIKVMRETPLFAYSDQKTGSTEPRCRTHKDWHFMARKIVDVARKLHNNQIYHGDIQPKKFLFSSKNLEDSQVSLVDFGAHVDYGFGFGAQADPFLKNSYAAPEKRLNKVEANAACDIYSIGGILYYLATGSAPPDILTFSSVNHRGGPWRHLNSQQTEDWKTLIQEHFRRDAAQLVGEGHEIIVKVIDKCLRPNPGERYTSVERLRIALAAIKEPEEATVRTVKESFQYAIDELRDIFQPSAEAPEQPASGVPPVDASAAEAGELSPKHVNVGDIPADNLHPFFQRIVESKLELLIKEIKDMKNDHYELVGEREDLIDDLVKYMSFLGSGDEYLTITAPHYWTRNNLGINGRFLTINRDLVRRGVHVRRLFLSCVEDFEIKNEHLKILEAHLKAAVPFGPEIYLEAFKMPPEGSTGKPGTIWLGSRVFSKEQEVADALAVIPYVAIWKKNVDPVEWIALTFTSNEEDSVGPIAEGAEIVKVRFKQLKDGTEFFRMAESMSIQGSLATAYKERVPKARRKKTGILSLET